MRFRVVKNGCLNCIEQGIHALYVVYVSQTVRVLVRCFAQKTSSVANTRFSVARCTSIAPLLNRRHGQIKQCSGLFHTLSDEVVLTVAKLMGMAMQFVIEPVFQKIFFVDPAYHIAPKQLISYYSGFYAARN